MPLLVQHHCTFTSACTCRPGWLHNGLSCAVMYIFMAALCSGMCCLSAAEEARDDCYPARVHATLDLLDRHLATMKDQLTPKPLPGRAPPKKVVSFPFTKAPSCHALHRIACALDKGKLSWRKHSVQVCILHAHQLVDKQALSGWCA